MEELQDAAWIESPGQFEDLCIHHSRFGAGDPGAHLIILVEVGRTGMKHRFDQE